MTDAVLIAIVVASGAVISSAIGVVGILISRQTKKEITNQVGTLRIEINGRMHELLDSKIKESAATANQTGRQELKQEQKERRQEDEDRETRKTNL